MKYFPFIKLPILVGLVVFYLCWLLPSMRSTRAYGEAQQREFWSAYDCSTDAFNQGRYSDSSKCYDVYDRWESRNSNPEPGWHMPWYVWKETSEVRP